MNYIQRFIIVGIFSAIMFFIYLFIGVSTTYAGPQEYMWPVQGELSDTFGTRDGTHYGIDIAVAKGTEVSAAKSGRVIKSYFSSSYGNVIILSHEDNKETLYAHLSKRLKGEGEAVKQGEVIGTIGSTGHSTGPHLHFEFHEKEWREDKKFAADPLTVLNPSNLPYLIELNREFSKNSIADSEQHKVKPGDTLRK
ncbi:M23 family metallopeptidase [Alteribacillus sp. JSM 102045]|uniref:M23 family metallopeptidase n=1 Tax=Alteribacillus sp. JSM 102045 TaxID=1562101 RepID=UPI0035C1CDBE